MDERDPVQARADESLDLYDITSWETRTSLDRLSVSVYRGLLATGRAVVVLAALLILLLLLATASLGALLTDPTIGLLTVLSAIPALALAGYVYVADVTSSEPLSMLVATFVLGVLFAGFAGIVNSLLGPRLRAIGFLGFILFFYLVVAPVEETVKWLAVRLYAYRSDSFDAVIDGAVYGAMAGLGFATIENALYISQQVQGSSNAAAAGVLGLVGVGNIINAGGQITALRALAGPGHVIYSAFAGYYLGLAKFNPENAGPIVVKGLLIAAFIHATYNTLVGIVPAIITASFGIGQFTVFIGFVLVYDGLFGYALYRKIADYRRTYRRVHEDEERDEHSLSVDRTEFDA